MTTQTIVYALDFDGVICDSAVETGVAGWKAAMQIWDTLSEPLPSQKILNQFREVRPVMETGYEAILIIKMLHDGEQVDDIVNHFPNKISQLINEADLNVETLKKLFGETRDHWIDHDLDEWVNMNPLFLGVAEKLKSLTNEDLWYIVTTKQERFVKYILDANQIDIPSERVFGLDRKMSKEAVLLGLVDKHPKDTICFVEDRLPSLFNVMNNQGLSAVRLFLALWGYNTEQDKLDAEQENIKSILLDDFLA